MLLKTIDIAIIINYFGFFTAYFLTCALSGYFQAWIAKLLGDPTGARSGFLTFNPFLLVDWLGFFFLISFLRIGWIRSVPINSARIQGPYRRFRRMILYLLFPLSHVVIATLAFLLLYFVYSLGGSIGDSATINVHASPITFILTTVLIKIIAFNSSMAVVGFFWRLIEDALLFLILKKWPVSPRLLQVLFFTGPLLLLFFFSRPILMFISQFHFNPTFLHAILQIFGLRS